jgi:hypothetical protein
LQHFKIYSIDNQKSKPMKKQNKTKQNKMGAYYCTLVSGIQAHHSYGPLLKDENALQMMKTNWQMW